MAEALRQSGLSARVLSLAPAPCIDYGTMGRQLEGALTRAKAAADRLLVVIGLCHPDIEEIVQRHGARRIDMHDCFEALLGREERRRLDAEMNTFYTTASWLPHWRRAMQRGMRWDDVDARQNFARYQRILLLDSGLHQAKDEDILAFFDYTGIPVEIRPVALHNLSSLLIRQLIETIPAR